jgi:hypothetical protein
LVTADEVPDPQQLELWLEVNGHTYQRGSTANMIFSVAFLVSYVSRFMSLQPGDIISTGTPPGIAWARSRDVSPTRPQDRLGIAGLGEQNQLVGERRLKRVGNLCYSTSTLYTVAVRVPSVLFVLMFPSCSRHCTRPVDPSQRQTLKGLSIEELSKIDVTSVSKHAEIISEAAAAVSVITSEDLRRAGVTELPEAMRLATGMMVARFNGETWGC